MDRKKLFLGCALAYTPIAVTISSVIVVIREEDPLYIFIGFMFALYAAAATTGIKVIVDRARNRAPTTPPPPSVPLPHVHIIMADVNEAPSVIGLAEDRTVVIVENPKPLV